MIRKMKWKFIATVMIGVAGLLLLILGSINHIQYMQMKERYDQLLDLVIENGGEFSKEFGDSSSSDETQHRIFRYDLKITKETPYENRYFLVFLDSQGNVQSTNTNHISSVGEEEATELAKNLFETYKSYLTENKDSIRGTYQKFRYQISAQDSGYVFGFADMYQQIQNNQYTAKLSLGIATTVLVIIFLIVFFAARRVLEPLILNMEKQKQFITDAGHELKTPLAVISADVDVIELTDGENEWTKSIRKQTAQMSELIKHLLYLSRMEETFEMVMQEVNLSRITEEVADRILPIAVSQNKKFTKEIEPDILYMADASAMEHLVSVLLENAVKYCTEEGEIELLLYKKGKTIHLEFRNSGEEIEERTMERLFDRFYRPDSDRNKSTGGYGIGLSVAKAIVTAHKGKITARNEKNKDQTVVAFCVEL